MKCPSCDTKKPMKTVKKSVKYKDCGLDFITIDKAEVSTCTHCGEEIIHYGNLIKIHEAIKDTLLKKDTALTGKEIVFLRKQVGWDQMAFAKKLKMSLRTIQRLEASEAPVDLDKDKYIRMVVASTEYERFYKLRDIFDDLKKGIRFKSIKINSQSFQVACA